jgi:CHAT domain-containing protein
VLQEALEGQGAHILHLACHGEQADSPLDSAFLLSDGRLTIQDLMSIRLPNAVLAFLSACQTAKGSEDLPDQAVHLAASMLFCGFRSVVGTMW